MLVYLLAFAVVLIAALLAYGAAALLHLHGTPLIVLVILIMLAGIAAAIIILVLHYRAKKRQSAEDQTADSGAGDIDLLLNDANRKLRTSRQQGPKTLNGLPLLYLLGERGSAKTTLVLRSGLDPELIAGTAPREGDVSPTPLLNLWFTRQAAILEAGEIVRQSQSALSKLVTRTRPKAYRSAFGSGAPPRAAIVCVSAEQLLAADAVTSSLASARAVGAQLREISRLLGAALPVYVIVTKLDRVPHFPEYVRNLSNEEARQVLGITLPRSEASAGIYADKATRELGGVLDSLTYMLGEFRVEMLSRETEQRNTAGVYEFPREFGKLRKNLNAYLVELCKPSQLSANPYLRGFYFTGVRALMSEQVVNAPAAAASVPVSDVGATRMFSIQELQAPSRPAPAPVMVSTRVPQWTFLARVFPEVILGDKSALTATKQTAPARLFRRILFGTLAVLLGLYLIFLFISYLNNSALERKMLSAAQALPAAGRTTVGLPSVSDLQALDQLRQTIVQLDGYKHDGPPWTYRFGLYQGDKLAARARRIYFDRFRPMLLNPAHGNFVTYLRSLPAAPSPGADYNAAYDPLKAYLITTSNPEKSVPQFLDPVFLQYWSGSNLVDPVQQQLARQQIDFYANELPRQNPYSINPDTAVVNHARGYLALFGAEPRIYQAMLTEAEKTAQPIDFNRLYPGSAAAVVEGHLIRGGFTRNGYSFMQDAFQHSDRYFKGETWVLGEQAGASLDPNAIGRNLAAKYSADYMKEWHAFLTDARVVPCGSLREAPGRLNTLAGPGSPLLELFYTVSHNTAVADLQIKSMFQPAQAMVDSEAVDKYIGPGNQNYVAALLGLAGAVSQVAANPAAATDPTAGAPIAAAASAADAAARQTWQNFKVDPQMHTENIVLGLLQAPIKCASGLAEGAGKAGANGAGQRICGALSSLLGKFPFNPTATTQATVAEVNEFFAPDTGTIWTAYNANLKPLLVQQGAQYVPAPGAPLTITPNFAQAFSRLARVSSELYPPGGKAPAFSFTLRSVPSKGIENASLVVDGQRIPNGSTSQQFNWNGGAAQQAFLAYNSAEGLQFQGPWALFQLAYKAHQTRGPGGTQLEFPLEVSGVQSRLPDGTPVVVRFELSGAGADLLSLPGMTGLHCAAPAVK